MSGPGASLNVSECAPRLERVILVGPVAVFVLLLAVDTHAQELRAEPAPQAGDIRIEGTARNGARVTVQIGRNPITPSGLADSNGRFLIRVPALDGGALVTLTESAEGNARSRTLNVVVGPGPQYELEAREVGEGTTLIRGLATPGRTVEVAVSGRPSDIDGPVDINGEFAVVLDPLTAGSVVTITESGGDSAPRSLNLVVFARPRQDDERSGFHTSFFAGVAVDTFAAENLQRYLNPEAIGSIQERGVAGIDFAYRLVGGPTSDRSYQVWLYGETVHGTRSTDIDCSGPGADTQSPVCSLFDIQNAPEQALYSMRNATSVEAFVGLRWEFLPIRTGSESPASVYLKAEAGFMTVTRAQGDAMDLHTVALGAVATRGPLADSYLEVGYGRSDFFRDRRNRRWRIEAYAEWELPLIPHVSPFARINGDFDLDPGPDSIQSYFGLNLDITSLFGS